MSVIALPQITICLSTRLPESEKNSNLPLYLQLADGLMIFESTQKGAVLNYLMNENIQMNIVNILILCKK